MEKIKIVIVLLLLLCGCSIEKTGENWIDMAVYNGMHHTAQEVIMVNDANTVYSYPMTQGRKKNYYFPIKIENNEISSMIDKEYSTCSYTNVDACSNLMEYYPVNMNFYKGQLYFYEKRIEVEQRLNYLMDIDIKTAQVDLLKEMKHTTIHSFGEPVFYEIKYTYPNIQIHKDKIYACYNNELYIGSIDSSKLLRIEILEQKNILKVFLDEEKMYIYAKEYKKDGKLHKYVVLECDLDGNVKSVVVENMNVMFVDQNFVFYTIMNANKDTEWYKWDMNLHTSEKIIDGEFKHIFKYENQYLLDTMGNDENRERIAILDEKGKVVVFKDYVMKDKHISGLFMGNKYYVYCYKENWYGYYEITEDGISDLIMLNEI